ncbi:MAG TPA: hypothetical protein VKU82_09055, partial [Planctomycetaceae bacterium]|nr:hypothetical protein [Planctomycetaceae bacterium]
GDQAFPGEEIHRTLPGGRRIDEPPITGSAAQIAPLGQQGLARRIKARAKPFPRRLLTPVPVLFR